MPTEPTLIEGVKRTNIIMIHLNQRAVFFPQNLYVIDINRRNRNYYSCGGFGYLAKNCRNRENRIGEERRLEYG